MQRFWSLVLLHHYAVPARWGIGALFAGLILGSELLLFLLPPLPPMRLFLTYLRIFLFRLGEFEISLLMGALLIPLFLLSAGFQDLGGKVFALTLPVSRSEYFWARLVYTLFPLSALAIPYLALLMLPGDDPLSSSIVSSMVRDRFLVHAIMYFYWISVIAIFLIVGWFIRRGEIALIVTLVLVGILSLLLAIGGATIMSPTQRILAELLFLLITISVGGWLVAKADVGQEGT